MSRRDRGEHPVLNINVKAAGSHDGAWRHPDTDPAKVGTLDGLTELALGAEEAGIDALFFADGLSYSPPKEGEFTPAGGYEPLTLAAALSARTSQIGFVVTASTTYSEPYNLARQFASLDQLSGGRGGWNIVTTSGGAAARNFGLVAHPDHGARYERADEFVGVTRRLWDSRPPSAPAGRAEAQRARPIDHAGPNFRVAGPLNVPRSPQGRPVLFQAGASADGRALAAAHADVVYTISQSIEQARELYRDLKGRAVAAGRAETSIKIVTGVRVLVEETTDAAQRKARELRELTDPKATLRHISAVAGIDLLSFDLDGPVPPLPPTEASNGIQTHLELLRGFVERERPSSVRELAAALDGGVGALAVTGSPVVVADWIEEWFEEGVTDGFNLGFQILQGGAQRFFDLVVPELRRRGLRPPAYPGRTLKANLGLSYPD